MIESFEGEHEFLSNFWPCKVVYEGIEYPSSEHAYQAAKAPDLETRLIIAAKKTPGQAKRAGSRRGCIIKNFDQAAWEDKKIDVMGDVCRIKFEDPTLRQLLKDTGDQELQEGNNHNDTFWGVSLKTGKGRNVLGLVLMIIRNEILQEDAIVS